MFLYLQYIPTYEKAIAWVQNDWSHCSSFPSYWSDEIVIISGHHLAAFCLLKDLWPTHTYMHKAMMYAISKHIYYMYLVLAIFYACLPGQCGCHVVITEMIH